MLDATNCNRMAANYIAMVGIGTPVDCLCMSTMYTCLVINYFYGSKYMSTMYTFLVINYFYVSKMY